MVRCCHDAFPFPACNVERLKDGLLATIADLIENRLIPIEHRRLVILPGISLVIGPRGEDMRTCGELDDIHFTRLIEQQQIHIFIGLEVLQVMFLANRDIFFGIDVVEAFGCQQIDDTLTIDEEILDRLINTELPEHVLNRFHKHLC